MVAFVVRRLISMVFVMFAISVLTYAIFFATPGVDPAARIAGRNADPATLAAVKHDFGLDRPLPGPVRADDEEALHQPRPDLVRQPRQPGDPADRGRRAR